MTIEENYNLILKNKGCIINFNELMCNQCIFLNSEKKSVDDCSKKAYIKALEYEMKKIKRMKEILS